MSLSTQISQAFHLHIWTSRWLLAVLSLMLCALAGMAQVRGLQVDSNADANIWDVVFTLFNSVHLVLYISGLLFAFLLAQISEQNTFSNYTLLRLPSRGHWWFGRVAIMAYVSILYTLFFVLGIFLIATPSFEWSNEWSNLARARVDLPISDLISAWLIVQSPVAAILTATLLLCLGSFAIGLVVQVGVVFSRKPVVGFAIAASFILAAIAINNWGTTSELPKVFVHTHWVLIAHSANFPVWHSLLYWGGVILTLIAVGYWRVRQLDFLT